MARKQKVPTAPSLDWDTLVDAQQAHMAAGLPSRTGPLVRASQLRKLDELQRRFVAGEQWMLIVAINTCAVHELLMPEWVRQEWLKRSRRALHYQVKSWDDVMPVIKPTKNSKLPALRRAWRWTLPVVMAVHAKSASGRAIDDGMFEELVEENDWKFSAGFAKKLYYREKEKPYFVAFMREYYFPKPKRRTGKNSTIRQRS